MLDWMLGLAPDFWQLLQNASQGQATFLGSLIGSSIGLIALLLGALFNAHLNRRRDNRLRREEREAVAAALMAELVGFHNNLQSEEIALKMLCEQEQPANFFVSDIVQVRVLPDMVPKLGLLEWTTIRLVIRAYNAAEGFREALIRNGGTLESTADVASLRRIAMP